MNSIIENKILGIREQMNNMETEPMYYLKPAWANLTAQLQILKEVLGELNVLRAVELKKMANREFSVLGEISPSISRELERLVDSFNEVEGNAFLRLMGEEEIMFIIKK